MAKKVHDVDRRAMLSISRIVEEMDNGASGELISVNCGNGKLNGDFFRSLCLFHAANQAKPAFTKKSQKNVRRATDEVAKEVEAGLPAHSEKEDGKFEVKFEV